MNSNCFSVLFQVLAFAPPRPTLGPRCRLVVTAPPGFRVPDACAVDVLPAAASRPAPVESCVGAAFATGLGEAVLTVKGALAAEHMYSFGLLLDVPAEAYTIPAASAPTPTPC